MEGTFSLRWTSSFTTIGLITYPPSKGRTTLPLREKDLKLVFDMPDSNRNWKSKFFFVEGTDWVCREEEWAIMPHGYFDNTWAFVRESG